ncbi:MAG: hypothetical protein M5U12_38000 [Verrucomicrobia bacterium]|nr:hypothetical protein [Verrucomicrobiota bacterium]
MNAGLPDQELAPALGLDLAPSPEFERGAWGLEPVEAFLGALFGELAEVAGEVLAGGLDADDAALGVEGEDVDDPEEVLPDAVGGRRRDSTSRRWRKPGPVRATLEASSG